MLRIQTNFQKKGVISGFTYKISTPHPSLMVGPVPPRDINSFIWAFSNDCKKMLIIHTNFKNKGVISGFTYEPSTPHPPLMAGLVPLWGISFLFALSLMIVKKC